MLHQAAPVKESERGFRQQEAARLPRQAVPAKESETDFPRPAALRVSALPQAHAELVSAQRWVQSQAAWRRRAALPCAHRAAVSAWPARWAQRVALPRMEARAAACAPAVLRLVARCVPAEQQSGVQAVACAQAEPPLAASVRAVRLPEAASDAQAEQRPAAVLAVRERRRGAALLAALAQQPEAVVLAVPAQQPGAVVLVAPEQRPAVQKDGQAEQRQGAAEARAVWAQRPAAPPSAAASAFLPDRLLPSSPPAPRRAARFAHAMRSL
ncbi:hypothetical protein ACVJGD_006065 [Bradyrhizobium sp. USDA 10063]